MARILRTEEKRSDVNLATMLLVDCVFDTFDEAVIVSNDSDLALPIEYAVNSFGKTVGVINPQNHGKPSGDLSNVASWTYKAINSSVLANSQFSAVVNAGNAWVTKPSTW